MCVCKRDRWGDEQVECERDGKVLGISEGKEGVVGEVGIEVRDPPPEAKGTTTNAAIKHARTASGGGGGAVIEREE